VEGKSWPDVLRLHGFELQIMRLLFLSNFYPPYELGGYEQWAHEVAEGLVERGHKVSVLTSSFGVEGDDDTDDDKVTRTLFLQTNNDYYRPWDFFFRRSMQEAHNKRELEKMITTFQPDLVMVWGMWNLSHFLPYWAEQWMPGRVAYFISNYWPQDLDAHRLWWQLPTNHRATKLLKRPLRTMAMAKLEREGYPPTLRFEHAVCCSEYVRATLVAAGKLPEGAGVLLGGTEPEPFIAYSKLNLNTKTGRDQRLKLLYFGRLIPDKGVHTAVEAMGLLKEQGLAENIDLTILGSGHPDYEKHLHALVDELELQEQVSFVGKVARNDMPRWLGSFDVFLFTSIWPEPMARSVMEAMASGLLVIGTEVGGQEEMLSDGQNALTFEPGDVEHLALQIKKAAGDPSLRLELARAGQQMVLEWFTLDRMVREIEQYLMDIVENVPAIAD
jgi:glycogen(starch) synthase